MAAPTAVAARTTIAMRVRFKVPLSYQRKGTFGFCRGLIEGIVEALKQARVVGRSDVGGREATLVQRCAGNDDAACAELVSEHQRMVVQLALNLLGDREEALDLSQEVFLRVFRTIHRFRGQSSLRTWIYRIAVNQARNRHRFWRRRHRADQVSLDQHIAAHGDFLSAGESTPDRVLAQKELGERLQRAIAVRPRWPRWVRSARRCRRWRPDARCRMRTPPCSPRALSPG